MAGATAAADRRPLEIVTATAGSADTVRTCPVCLGENAATREICGRCGVDLDDGRSLPTTALLSPLRPGPSVRRRRWWVPVAAAVLVIAGVAAGLVVGGVGPFDRRPEMVDVTFDPATYPGDAEPLTLSSVATLTTAGADASRAFTPEQMVDEDPSTAWRSDVDRLPEGANEVVDLFLTDPAWISELVLRNGDHLDAAAYEASGRVQRARLRLDGGVTFTLRLLDLGRQPQLVSLPEPVLTTTVRLELLSVIPDEPATDVAIAEIGVRGVVADETDRRLAEERAERQPATGPVTVAVS